MTQETTTMNQNSTQVEYEKLIQRHFELALEKARFEMNNSAAELEADEKYQELLAEIRVTEANSDGMLTGFNVNDYRAAFKAFSE